MARYIGPKTKIARKFGEPIYGPDKYFERKNHPPGQHGTVRRRRKISEYGIQLKEKQKVKYTYGLLERQFHNLFKKANSMKGRTGENLLLLLESRLDNIVFRMGIAPSRQAARQLVTHRHITVDGKICNIPSALIRPGSLVAVRERSKNLEVIQENISRTVSKYPWIEWDVASVSGKFLNYPERTEIPEPINEQLIVELYSK
ncbi:MAG: 30S ribosomal protein S4 [Bacteroidales bacterium]|jgi:small subunit ribosomal protein S4|nr:30S ribosomal protein S4 [Bacteroidales bacterium]HHV40628.1 30S ribosomal protein S4 [Bacteroidales bacterium]